MGVAPSVLVDSIFINECSSRGKILYPLKVVFKEPF